MPKSPGQELASRLVAAASASTLSAIIVTPLDVIKTRMQVAAVPTVSSSYSTMVPIRSTTTSGSSIASICQLESLNSRGAYIHNLYYSNILRGATLNLCPTCSPRVSSLAASPCATAALGRRSIPVAASPGMLSTLQSIVSKEGVGVLWRGLDKAMLLSIPMVGIYMPLYDHLHAQLKRDAGIYAPALAGMAARAVAVSATAPLELLRTRQQASHSNTPGHSWSSLVGAQQPCSTTSSSSSSFNIRQLQSMLPRVKGMWTGLGATLARDVPFTALYWCNVEPIRHRLLPPGADAPTTSQVFWANLTAGSVSGALAAAATTPFDVVKTRLQTAGSHGQLPRGFPGRRPAHPARCMALNQLSTLGMLRSIWYTEGMRGLFTGVGPRVARAAPACAIVISSYEVIKKVL